MIIELLLALFLLGEIPNVTAVPSNILILNNINHSFNLATLNVIMTSSPSNVKDVILS